MSFSWCVCTEETFFKLFALWQDALLFWKMTSSSANLLLTEWTRKGKKKRNRCELLQGLCIYSIYMTLIMTCIRNKKYIPLIWIVMSLHAKFAAALKIQTLASTWRKNKLSSSLLISVSFIPRSFTCCCFYISFPSAYLWFMAEYSCHPVIYSRLLQLFYSLQCCFLLFRC